MAILSRTPLAIREVIQYRGQGRHLKGGTSRIKGEMKQVVDFEVVSEIYLNNCGISISRKRTDLITLQISAKAEDINNILDRIQDKFVSEYANIGIIARKDRV